MNATTIPSRASLCIASVVMTSPKKGRTLDPSHLFGRIAKRSCHVKSIFLVYQKPASVLSFRARVVGPRRMHRLAKDEEQRPALRLLRELRELREIRQKPPPRGAERCAATD